MEENKEDSLTLILNGMKDLERRLSLARFILFRAGATSMIARGSAFSAEPGQVELWAKSVFLDAAQRCESEGEILVEWNRCREMAQTYWARSLAARLNAEVGADLEHLKDVVLEDLKRNDS